MKRFVSLLAVAALAVTFGSACGRHKECKDAGSKAEECVAAKFEDGKFDELGCKWVDKDPADKTKGGECKGWIATQAAIDACKVGTKDNCANTVSGQDETVCKWDEKATADHCKPAFKKKAE